MENYRLYIIREKEKDFHFIVRELLPVSSNTLLMVMQKVETFRTYNFDPWVILQ